MIYKTTTQYPLETVKSQMQEHAKAVGFGVLGTYAFKQILESKGHPIEKDITVFELCNPVAAQSALDTLPEISVYLPCRLSLYEENGKTTLATIGIEDMLGAVEVEEDFKVHMSEIFHKVRALMNGW